MFKRTKRKKVHLFQFIYCSIPPRYSAILIEIPIAFHIPDRKSDPVRLTILIGFLFWLHFDICSYVVLRGRGTD